MKVTSRQRPGKLINIVKQYLEKASNPSLMSWLFSFDEDDESLTSEVLDRLDSFPITKSVVFGVSENKIHAINRDVNECGLDWDILLNISDDQIPEHLGYDDLIRNAMPESLDASLWFYDGCQPRINTQEIVGRTYYERFRYIYHPSYKSFYCDNEATEVAQSLGKLIKSDRCIIRHHHPAAIKTVANDSLYDRNQKYWTEDQNNFKARKANSFK